MIGGVAIDSAGRAESPMTLAVTVAVPEGVVVGADSRMTYSNPRSWPRTASDYGHKVFQIGGRVAAATYGWAFLNRKNISSLIEEFKLGPFKESRVQFVDEVAPLMAEFFQQQYDQHIAAKHDKPVDPGVNAFGFLVGGYDKNNVTKLTEVMLPGKTIRALNGAGGPGAGWAGQYDTVSRLIKGWDPTIYRQVSADVQKLLDKGEYIVRFQNMTLQDAIDFVVFLIRATIDMQRFSDGTADTPGSLPGVGGPIDIAVITPYAFQWVQRKRLQGERTTIVETLGLGEEPPD